MKKYIWKGYKKMANKTLSTLRTIFVDNEKSKDDNCVLGPFEDAECIESQYIVILSNIRYFLFRLFESLYILHRNEFKSTHIK